MQVEVFKDDTDIDFYAASGYSMHAETFLGRKKEIFELKLWSDA